MGSRDERIVQMTFDNAQFEKGVAQTTQSLQNLDKSLQLADGSKAFAGIGNAAKNVDLSSIVNGVDQLSQRFSLMGIVGMKVMEEVAQYGINIIKGIWSNTFGQIKSGGIKRAMNIENAHFMLQGLLGDEKEVQRIMGLASDSVDGTAYSYDAAAKAASQFAASGITSNEELATSLRAITGVAAMTNAEYEDISRIFTTVAGNGRLMGDQLLQLSGRGMNAAATLVDYFNGVNDGSKEASESVKAYIQEVTGGAAVAESDIRDMVSKGKISFEVFSAAMDEAFGEHAKKANETFTGAMSNVKAALSRIGAKFVSPLIEQNGNLVQMLNSLRLMINAINKEMGPFADGFVNAVKGGADALKYLMDNLNVTDLFKGLGEGLRIISTLLAPIGKAFRKAFIITDAEDGSNTIDKINAAITRFKEKLESIKPYHSTLTKIQKSFEGLFAIVKIGVQIVSALFRVFGPLFGVTKDLSSGILDLTSSWGEWLVNLEASLRESNFFVEVFTKVKDTIIKVITVIRDGLTDFWNYIEPLRTKISDIFTEIVKRIKSLDLKGAFDKIKGIFTGELSPETIKTSTDALSKFHEILAKIKVVLGNVRDAVLKFAGGLSEAIDSTSVSSVIVSAFTFIINGLATAIKYVIDLFGTFGGKLKEAVKSIFTDFNFEKLTNLLSTGAFVLALKKLAGALQSLTLGVVTDDLKAIASSIGILTLSLIGLSLIDQEKLSSSLKAITVLFTDLSAAYMAMTGGFTKGNATGGKWFGNFLGAFTGLNKIGLLILAIKKNFEMKAIANLAKAILMLSAAVALLSLVDAEGMKRGLLAITVLLAELTIVAKLMPQTNGLYGVGMQVMAIAAGALILVAALKSLSGLDTNQMTNSLVGLGILLAELAIFSKAMQSAGGLKGGFSFIELATGILILSVALERIGSLDMVTIGKGLIGIAGGLAVMVAALRMLNGGTSIVMKDDLFMGEQSGSLLKTGAAILVVATAMVVMANAIEKLGAMPFTDVAQGVLALAATMAAVVVAFKFIDADGIMGKAAALLVVGAAMVIFASAIERVGALDFNAVGTGLAGLAGAIVLVVAALKLLTMDTGGNGFLGGLLPSNNNSLLKAAGAITIVAVAMNIMASALKSIGSMDLNSIGNALAGLGGTMLLMVTSFALIDSHTALATAGAITVFAAAMNLLVPPFVILGNLKFESIMKALIAMAGAMVLLKAAVVGLGPSSAILITVSGSLALFGVAMTAVGVGVLALSAAITSLVVTIASVPGAVAILGEVIVVMISNAIKALADSIGYILIGIAEGIVQCISYLSAHGDEIVGAITTIFWAVITALVELIAGAVYLLFETFAATLEKLANSNTIGRLVDGFFTIIHQVLIALETHVDEFVTDVVRLFVLVIYSLIKNLGTILSACVDFVVQFVKGLAAIIVEQSGPIVEAVNDIVLSIAYLLIEVLKELVSVIPGLGDLIGSGLEDAQGWIVNHMSEENGQKIIEDWANGVDTGIQQAGDKWAASAKHAALLVTAEARNALSAWDIRSAKEDVVGFQTARLEPDAYYYNRVGRASYNPEQDYSSTVQPRNTYKGSNYQLDAITKDSKTNVMDSVSNMGQGATDVLKGSLGDWGSVADESADDFTNRILKNADNAANATDYMGQAATGSLTYYIPMYGETGSKSIIEYGSMILAGTDRTVKASDKVAGASVGKIAEYYSRYSSTGTNNVDAYIASVYAGQGKASSAGGGVGNANVSGLASVNPMLRSTGTDAIANYATGITGAAGKSVSAATQVASSSATSVGQKKDDFWDAGNQATIGFANGITEMISRAISAAGNVARAALNQLKAVLGIHSPSREFMKAGEYSGEGYVIGLKNYQDAIEKESGSLADASIKAFSDGIQMISDIADSNSKYEPTIRPVFDMTNVNNGMAALNDILAPESTMAMQNTLSSTFDMASEKDDIWKTLVDENAKHEANLRQIIESQNEMLASIKRGLANQKIVLDSGELVGQTIERIDNALEERAVRVGRGN